VLFSYGAGENELRLVDVASGESEAIGEPGEFYHPAYAHAEVEPEPVVLDLAFVSDRDGQYAVYLVQAGRLDTWQALPRPADYERAWWPTFCGDYVAYEAQDLTGLEPQWIYLFSPDVSEPIRYRSALEPAQLGVPRCSPSGELMAFSIYLPDDDAGWRLAVNDSLAIREYVLEGTPGFGYVTWSNRTDFFLSMTILEGEFYVLSSANFDGVTALATLAKGKYPALSPNGNRFVYLCSNQAYLCIQDVDGGSPALLTEVVSIRLAGEDVPVTAMWSADGAWIYFSSAADGDWDIYRIRPNGTGLQNLTAGWDSNELMPAVDQGG
jgi:Tol biopolymer transport system component